MDPSRYGVPGSRSVSTEPTGFYRGVVKAVDGDTVTVQVPRLFGGAQIPDVPVAGLGCRLMIRCLFRLLRVVVVLCWRLLLRVLLRLLLGPL